MGYVSHNMNRPNNFFNDGRGFETSFKKTVEAYRHKEILRLEKVSPPARVMGDGNNRKVIFLPNPFLDWVGTWTERNGRALMIECKSTSEPKLTFGGGISDNQIEWLLRWHYAGVAVGVCWEFVGEGVAFIPVGQIHRVNKEG